MNNLLPGLPPAFSDAKVAERTTAGKTWLPARADPGDDKNIPFGLDGAFSKETGKGKHYYLTSVPPVADPNHRNVDVVYQFGDPSPLSSSERGVLSETSHIAMPKAKEGVQSSVPRRGSKKDAEGDEPLVLQVNNLLEGDLEVYIQRASAMQLSLLRPNMKCERCLTDTKKGPHRQAGKENPPLAVLFSTVLKISAIITGRHEVRAFHFSPGQIGIEVEMLYQRLICTRVVPGSQAHIHEEALNGSEILSVNGARVVTLDEFQHAVVVAYESGSVVIGAAAYKTTREHPKHKKDFAHFIGSTKVEFKSLLSNMMRSGLDKDHQHDIGPGKHGGGDDDDDDDSSSSSSSSSAGSPRPDGDAKENPQTEGTAQADRGAGDAAADQDADEDDDPEEDERRRNSDSDSDEDNKISIRKAPVPAKRVYAGNEDGEDGSMLVARRNTKDHGHVLYSPRDDDENGPADLEDEQGVLEAEIDPNDEQEAIEVVTEAKPPVIAHEAKEAWDYTTALELEESIPFSTLVCVPRLFQKSLGWGDPQKCVQFTNYSAKWDIQICWVDEESAVVPRCRLRSGQKHIELTSPKHVWVIIATLADKKAGRSGPEEHGHHLDSSVQGTAMILRPSIQALGTRKYTSAMWIPGQSMTATQRLRSKVPPTHKLRPDSIPKEYQVLPNLMVSVLDGATSRK